MPFYVPSVLSFVGFGMVVPLLALFARAMGATVAGAGIIVGLFGLGHVLFNIPAGFLITRFGMRRTLLGATMLEAAVAFVLGFVGSLPFLALFVFLLGCVHTVFYVTRLSFFRALVPLSHRGRALAMLGGCNRFGQFAGPIAGGVVTELFGYSYAFWGFSAFMCVSSVLLFLRLPRAEVDTGDVSGDGVHWIARAIDIVRTNGRIFATAGTAIVVLQLLRASRQVLIPLVGESVGLSVSQVGYVFGIMFFLELLFFYPVGIIMDRFGRKATAIPCLALLSLAFLLLPLVTGFFSMILVALAAGIGNGLGSGINMTLSADFAPSRNPGEFIGVWRFIADSGTAGGPFLVAAAAGVLSLGGASVAVTLIGLGGVMIMALFVPEPLQRVGMKSGTGDRRVGGT
ncbi:MAG: MFS transporter [Spirochaetaceae bacterium]|nr:MAG: MFS transporter [Spirochaetaceae bacterium]